MYDINGDGCIGRNELAKLIYAVHELMGRRPHQPDDDRKAREQVTHTNRIVVFVAFLLIGHFGRCASECVSVCAKA